MRLQPTFISFINNHFLIWANFLLDLESGSIFHLVKHFFWAQAATHIFSPAVVWNLYLTKKAIFVFASKIGQYPFLRDFYANFQLSCFWTDRGLMRCHLVFQITAAFLPLILHILSNIDFWIRARNLFSIFGFFVLIQVFHLYKLEGPNRNFSVLRLHIFLWNHFAHFKA